MFCSNLSSNMGEVSFKISIMDKVSVGLTFSLVMLLVTCAGARWATSVLNIGKAQFPLVGQDIGNAEQRRKAYNQDARQLYNEGYTKHGTRPFRITTFDGRLFRFMLLGPGTLTLHSGAFKENTS